MGALPIDFEAKVKDPKQIGGGYPYSIKAMDLMKNFVDAKLEVDQSVHSSGLKLKEVVVFGSGGHPGRMVQLDPDYGFGTNHPWAVSFNATTPANIDVKGGTVYHETGSITVSDSTNLASDDFVCLKITRDATSREVTAAEIGVYATGTFTSDSTYQYLPLAAVGAEITQLKFEDVSVFEDLAVVNGSFKLVSLEMSAPNFYELP